MLLTAFRCSAAWFEYVGFRLLRVSQWVADVGLKKVLLTDWAATFYRRSWQMNEEDAVKQKGATLHHRKHIVKSFSRKYLPYTGTSERCCSPVCRTKAISLLIGLVTVFNDLQWLNIRIGGRYILDCSYKSKSFRRSLCSHLPRRT